MYDINIVEQVNYINKKNNIELEIIKNLYNRKELLIKRELIIKEREILAYTGKSLEELCNTKTPEIEKIVSIITGKTLNDLCFKPKKHGNKKIRIEDLSIKETDNLIIEILEGLIPYESESALVDNAELIAEIDLYFINNSNRGMEAFKEEELLSSNISKLDIFQIYRVDDKYLLVGHVDNNYIVCEYDNILELRDSINCRYIDFNNEDLLKEIEELTIKEMSKYPKENLSELL